MVIFHSYLSLPEGNSSILARQNGNGSNVDDVCLFCGRRVRRDPSELETFLPTWQGVKVGLYLGVLLCMGIKTYLWRAPPWSMAKLVLRTCLVRVHSTSLKMVCLI